MALFVAVKRSHSRFLLLAAVLLAFFWRTTRLDFQSLWRDEVDAIYFAVRPLAETLAMFVQAAQNGPLYFLGLRPWFAVAGTTEFALRLPYFLVAVAGLLLFFFAAPRLTTAKIEAARAAGR